MNRLKLALCILAAALAGVFAPSALAGVITTVTIGPSLGTGSGSVIGTTDIDADGPPNPLGFGCGVTPVAATPNPATAYGCGPAGFALDDSFVVVAIPAAGSIFVSWGGTCPNPAQNASPTCSFAVGFGAPPTVTLRPVFDAGLGITLTKTGQGTVVSSGGIFNCPPTCGAQTRLVPVGTVITFQATPAPGFVLSDWGGACNNVPNTSSTCTFTVTPATTSVSVAFVSTFPLVIEVTGPTGAGTVTISPGNVVCPPTCNAQVVAGTTITATPNPSSGFSFIGFNGPCTGQTCQFTMTHGNLLTANFGTAGAGAVDANVNRRYVTYNGPSGRERVVNVKVTAGQQVQVLVEISRRGNEVAQRTFSNVQGTRTFRIPLSNGLPNGTYLVEVRFTNQFSQSKQAVNRTVNLKSP